LDVLGTNHPLAVRLGSYTLPLTNYCWMADYKRVPFRDSDQDFYADDYLLFPQATEHLDHICPEVKRTYRPYFRRALQALRTEDPANAARWVGSLLHFVEDTGSPPHAAEIRGDLHTKMENWVQASLIHLPGYQPRLLGTDEDRALVAFLQRMDELIEFSKPRGKSLATKVLIGQRAAVEPVVLECALETSRVVADLLHTLGHLAEASPTHRTAVIGTIASKAAPLLERVPARIVVLGTNWSTLTDRSGRFEFRGLPPGDYELVAFRPGSGSTNLPLHLAQDRTNVLHVTLPDAPANLIRNGDFRLRWLRPEAPDCWTRTDLGWEGEIIPLQPGQRYRLKVDFQTNTHAQAEVMVRWTRSLPFGSPATVKLPRIEARALTAERDVMEFTGGDAMGLLQVTIQTKAFPQQACSAARLVTVDRKEE
jgi:hypothetical protein